MKNLPLLAATAIGLLGIFAVQPSFAGSDHGGQVTVTEDDDDQGATAGESGDHAVAENDEADHDSDGVETGSHEGDQGDDEDGDQHDGDQDSGSHDGTDSGHEGGGEGGGDD